MINKKEEKKEENGLFEITAKAVILNDEGMILVVRRSETDPRNPGKWDLPGGTLMRGENLEKALRREIKEEFGIEVRIGIIIHHIDFGKERHGKGLRFLTFYESGEVKISNEHSSFEWLALDEAIAKFADKGFENDKRDSLIKAKEYLELKNSLDGWKRCQADFENYKKRQAETQKDFVKFSCQNVVMEILPILDNFYASTDHIPAEQKDTPWVTGIMHIQKQLEDVLKNYGVTEIETKVGDEFNPEIHEAVHPVKSSPGEVREAEFNRVKKIIQKGYKIDGKVIRPARVIVE